jgi:hypothetical protein
MFFASYQHDNNPKPAWRLGEIVLKDTNRKFAKKSGIYKVRWWAQQPSDRQNRSIVDSRFWPEEYSLRANGTPGKRFTVKPSQAEQENERHPSIEWKTEDFNVAELNITGPFFLSNMTIPAAETHKRQGTKRQNDTTEDHRIISKIWKELELRAPRFGVSTKGIRDDPKTGPRANTRR